MTHSIRSIYTSAVAAIVRRAATLSSYEHGRLVAVILGSGSPSPVDAIQHAAFLLALACCLVMLMRTH
jgi:hypothetical protein